MFRPIAGAVFLWATACTSSVGPCDEPAALELVYTPEGIPAFAGQAIVQVSCGNGGFCHAERDIEPADRFGAPVDLGFDLRLASTSFEPNLDASQRLLEHQRRILSMRGEVLYQIDQGLMPPGGAAGREYRCQILPSECGEPGNDLVFDRFEDDGVTTERLPTLLDEDPARRREAREIVRNWLACRTPVVERTVSRGDRGANLTGFTQPVCNRTCVDVRWRSIYEEILLPTCSFSRCHDDDDPAGELSFTLAGDADAIHAYLTSSVAAGAQCAPGGQPLIMPGEPDRSLMLLKVEAASGDDVCGSVMPLSGGRLPEQRICALREWIQCGACPEDDGGACAACLDAARATCNVDPSSESGCLSADRCPNRAEL